MSCTAGVGIKLLVRKDTGSFQIIGLLPGGSAKLSGMVQDNDSLLKVLLHTCVSAQIQPARQISRKYVISMYIYIASHVISCAFPHPRKRPWAPVVVKCLHMPPTQKLLFSVAHSLAFSAVAQVGGKDVTGLKLDEVNKLLNGAPGSKVRVKLSRAGMPFDVTLVRAEDSAGKKAPTGCSPIDQTQFTGRTSRFLFASY